MALSLSFTARKGEYPFFSVNALGKYAAPANGVAPAITSALLNAFKKPVALEPLNIPTFLWGGKKLCLTEFTLSDGRISDANLYANCDAVALGQRNWTGRMTVRMEDVEDRDLIAESANAIIQTGSFIFGTTAGNRIEIATPTAQLKFAGFTTVGDDLAATIDVTLVRMGETPEISIKAF